MRLVLAFLLLITRAQAQPVFNNRDSAFIKTATEFPSREPFDTMYKYRKVEKSFVYLASRNDISDLFGYETSQKFRDFNFTDQHILGQQQCQQCLLFCDHENDRRSCHRNACTKNWTWSIRDNKKAFTIIPSIQLAHDPRGKQGSNQHLYSRDSITRSAADSTQAYWYTTGMGDCHARFSYDVVKDNYYPVLLLREMNYYGGCRAGGFFDTVISFKIPPGIWKHYKSEIIVEKGMN